MLRRRRALTFLLATLGIGLLPNYASIGVAAPVILIALRMLQGLALGGEYGGAATYVAEHAPDDRRGFYTSWIQTTATLGLFLLFGDVAVWIWGKDPFEFPGPFSQKPIMVAGIAISAADLGIAS